MHVCHLKPRSELSPFPGDGGLFSCTQYINPSPSTTLFGFIKAFIRCLPGTLLPMCTQSTRVLGYQRVCTSLSDTPVDHEERKALLHHISSLWILVTAVLSQGVNVPCFPVLRTAPGKASRIGPVPWLLGSQNEYWCVQGKNKQTKPMCIATSLVE